MKKFLSLCSLILILTACSDEWNHSDLEMPEELRTAHEEKLEEHLTVLQEDPENLEALFGAAFRYQQLGNWKKAVQYYEDVLELNPSDWATLNNLAYIYETMGEYETASLYIKKLYEFNPGDSGVISDAVRILLLAENPTDATLALENFARIKTNPEAPDLYMATFISDLYEEIYQWNLAHSGQGE